MKRVGALPSLTSLPEDALRMAPPARERGRELVHRALACAAALSVRDSGRATGGDHSASTPLSSHGSAQAPGVAGARRAGDGFADGVDGWRHSDILKQAGLIAPVKWRRRSGGPAALVR